jgi:hypothetical protein
MATDGKLPPAFSFANPDTPLARHPPVKYADQQAYLRWLPD